MTLQLARVAANEGALHGRAELDLIWQVLEQNAGEVADKLDWLRRHSPRVHRRRHCPAGRNCQWTPQLARSLRKPPALEMDRELWRLRYAPVWADTLDYAGWLVAGGPYVKRCHVPPRTWGGRMDVEQAVRRGLYPIGCSGTDNDGFASVGTCMHRGQWRCDPRYRPRTMKAAAAARKGG